MGQVITRVEDIGNLQGLPLAAGKGYVRRSDNQQWETRPFALLDAVNTIFAGGLQASNLMGTNTGDQSADQILPPQTGKAGQYLQSNGSDPSWQPAGSVTSVGLSAPSMFNVTVSPITSSGSLTFTLANQGMRTFLAGPGSGVPAAPTFRAISGIDLPIYQTGSAGAVPSSGVIGSPTKVLDQNGWNTLNFGYFSDTLPIASGGTGQTTANAAFNALAPAQATNGGKYLTTDGTNTSWASVSGGSAITALTGDVTATGPGSAVATLATVTIAKGGTGQITANAAFNALAPSQTGQNGNFLTTNGTNTSWAAVTVPVAGNPSTNVTLSATNGSAGTFMRSDAAPALSQAIAPTWTALHTFNRTLNSATVVTNAVAITPTASTTGTGGWAGLLVNVTQSSDTGSGTQRLVDFQLGGTSKFYVDSSGAITSQGLSITKASSAGGITMLSGVLGATGYTSIEMGRTAVDADIGIAGAASNFAAGSTAGDLCIITHNEKIILDTNTGTGSSALTIAAANGTVTLGGTSNLTMAGTQTSGTLFNFNNSTSKNYQLFAGGSASAAGTFGIYNSTDNVTSWVIDSTAANCMRILSGAQFAFSSSASFASTASDTGLARSSAGVVKVTNGSTGFGGLTTGSLTVNAALVEVPQTPTLSAGHVSTDASQGNFFDVLPTTGTTGAAFQLDNPTNATNGQKIIWRITQGATGGPFTITFGTNFDLAGQTITLSTAANKVDYIAAIYRSAATKWDVLNPAIGY